MHAHLSLQPLKATGGVHHFTHNAIGLIQIAEFPRFAVASVLGIENAREWNVFAHHRRRHCFGDLIAQREWLTQHPRGVLDRGFGLDGAVGDDLSHVVVAIFFGGVADHFATATLIEVDIDIWHRHPLRVEESLKQQAMLQRIQLGDAQCPSDQGAGCRATPRTHSDAVVLGVLNQVRHHQEVPGVAHLGNNAQLVLHLLPMLVRHRIGCETCR